MADLTKLLAGLLGSSPSNGGLNATNYPNQWGLRAYLKDDGTYGGDTMPKYIGWKDKISNLRHGGISTELSSETANGQSYPLITPNISQPQLSSILNNQSYGTEKISNDVYDQAEEFNRQRRAKGLSPFRDVFDDMPQGLLNR